jgi:hypothetical protein
MAFPDGHLRLHSTGSLRVIWVAPAHERRSLDRCSSQLRARSLAQTRPGPRLDRRRAEDERGATAHRSAG